MNHLSSDLRLKILNMLFAGAAFREIVEKTGVVRNTIAKLFDDAGRILSDWQDAHMVDLNVTDVVIRSDRCFSSSVRMGEDAVSIVDVWTWLALCRDTELIAGWLVGDGSSLAAKRLVKQISSGAASEWHVLGHDQIGNVRLTQKSELVDANAETNLHSAVLLNQLYGSPATEGEGRSSVSSIHVSLAGLASISPLFSRRILRHAHAIGFHAFRHNFMTVYDGKTLGMKAGILSLPLSLESVLTLIESALPAPRRPTTYQRRR